LFCFLCLFYFSLSLSHFSFFFFVMLSSKAKKTSTIRVAKVGGNVVIACCEHHQHYGLTQ
jgi:hypothetical protein